MENLCKDGLTNKISIIKNMNNLGKCFKCGQEDSYSIRTNLCKFHCQIQEEKKIEKKKNCKFLKSHDMIQSQIENLDSKDYHKLLWGIACMLGILIEHELDKCKEEKHLEI